jgi:hypothetical protein
MTAGWKKARSPFNAAGGFLWGTSWNGWSIFRADRRFAGAAPKRFIVIREPSIRPIEVFGSVEEARDWCERQAVTL